MKFYDSVCICSTIGISSFPQRRERVAASSDIRPTVKYYHYIYIWGGGQDVTELDGAGRYVYHLRTISHLVQNAAKCSEIPSEDWIQCFQCQS
jgi:hypothetical protein